MSCRDGEDIDRGRGAAAAVVEPNPLDRRFADVPRGQRTVAVLRARREAWGLRHLIDWLTKEIHKVVSSYLRWLRDAPVEASPRPATRMTTTAPRSWTAWPR